MAPGRQPVWLGHPLSPRRNTNSVMDVWAIRWRLWSLFAYYKWDSVPRYPPALTSWSLVLSSKVAPLVGASGKHEGAPTRQIGLKCGERGRSRAHSAHRLDLWGCSRSYCDGDFLEEQSYSKTKPTLFPQAGYRNAGVFVAWISFPHSPPSPRKKHKL